MNTIIVDGNLSEMEEFIKAAGEYKQIELINCFSDPFEAVGFAQRNRVDFMLLEAEFSEMNGIELAKKIRELYPDVIIIFVSRGDGYIKEAILDVKADYYITKPYNLVDVKEVFKRAALLCSRQKKRVYFKTFGRFDMFIDDNVVNFSNQKAKELLALCVDHEGGTVSMHEAIDKLWSNRVYDTNVKRLYRKAVIYLKSLFSGYDITTVFESGRASCHIFKNEVESDYYDYLENPKINNFKEPYLFEYSWAEEKNAKIIF